MNGKKQALEHEDFLAIRRAATRKISRAEIAAKAARAAEDINRFCRHKSVAFAWSGGKDSVALGYVAGLAGVSECVLGITDLEYSAFLAWVTAHMPDRLEVINVGLDLEWLAANPSMLFPANASIAAHWFAKVQHTAQRKYYRQYHLDVMLVGRRRSDGNFVGRNGENWYSADGITRFSPLADWSHADIFALIDHYGLKLPPFYEWPRGFRCGTHPWPARQWCKHIWQGWHEVYTIEKGIVERAASVIPSAAEYLRRLRG